MENSLLDDKVSLVEDFQEDGKISFVEEFGIRESDYDNDDTKKTVNSPNNMVHLLLYQILK